MSLNKKKLFVSILLVCAKIFLVGCSPVDISSPNVGEIGKPQISCNNTGNRVIISYPISSFLSDNFDFANMDINPNDLFMYGPDVRTEAILYQIPSSQTPISVSLSLEIDWIFYSEIWHEHKTGAKYREDTVTLPTCAFEDELPPVIEPTIQGGITHSCDADVLVVSFEFDQPVSGEIEFSWYDDELVDGEYAKVATTTVQNDTMVSFRLGNAYALEGTYNIQPSSLRFLESGESINIPNETLHWDACSIAEELLAPDHTPEIINATCVGKGAGKQLMIVFKFDQDVIGEYAALVADIPYELASVTQYPDRLYYFGTPPPQGPITIKLVSTSNQAIAYEEIYTPVVCGPPEKKEKDDDNGGYTPPNY